jgi:hypothetical protein
MLNIVAQSILQFNQAGCQDDNLFSQIDMTKPCRIDSLQHGFYENIDES